MAYSNNQTTIKYIIKTKGQLLELKNNNNNKFTWPKKAQVK